MHTCAAALTPSLQESQPDASALQKPQTLGPYMVRDVLTKKEALLSWIGVAIMFFVVLVPTTNQTILAYFTKQVEVLPAIALCTAGCPQRQWWADLTHPQRLVLQTCLDDMQCRGSGCRLWLVTHIPPQHLQEGLHILQAVLCSTGAWPIAEMYSICAGATGLWPHHCSVWASFRVSSLKTLPCLASFSAWSCSPSCGRHCLLWPRQTIYPYVSHTLPVSQVPRTQDSLDSRQQIFINQRKYVKWLNSKEAYVLRRYANGLVYAFSSLVLGWCVDRLNWPRTWLLVAANLLLAGMYVLEVGCTICWAHPEVCL